MQGGLNWPACVGAGAKAVMDGATAPGWKDVRVQVLLSRRLRSRRIVV